MTYAEFIIHYALTLYYNITIDEHLNAKQVKFGNTCIMM